MDKDYSTLIRIKGHPGFWINPLSKVIYWRGTIKGRKFKKSTGETQITKARAFVDDFILSLTKDNIKQARREAQGITNLLIKDVWSDIQEERAPTGGEATIRKQAQVWRMHLEPFWGSKHISDMNQRNIIKFEGWFLDKFPKISFFHAGKYLSMLINYMAREGMIPKRLEVRNIDKSSAAGKRKKHFRVYTTEESAALINHAVSDRARLALIAYFDTGMRKMELLARKWTDVDLKKRTIQVWSSKNKAWRDLPLTERLFDALAEASKGAKSDFIFAMKSGTDHISGQVFDKEWVATKKAAKIKGKARIHDIRHTFATKTSSDNWPVTIACKFLDMTVNIYMSTYEHAASADIFKLLNRSFGKG